MVHRDLNPGNLFLARTSSGTKLKILDFGVAKVLADAAIAIGPTARTVGNVRMFAPAYGAPEQFDDRIGAIGPWTDVYAIALVVLEALGDRTVMEGEHLGEFAMKALDADPPAVAAVARHRGGRRDGEGVRPGARARPGPPPARRRRVLGHAEERDPGRRALEPAAQRRAFLARDPPDEGALGRLAPAGRHSAHGAEHAAVGERGPGGDAAAVAGVQPAARREASAGARAAAEGHGGKAAAGDAAAGRGAAPRRDAAAGRGAAAHRDAPAGADSPVGRTPPPGTPGTSAAPGPPRAPVPSATAALPDAGPTRPSAVALPPSRAPVGAIVIVAVVILALAGAAGVGWYEWHSQPSSPSAPR